MIVAGDKVIAVAEKFSNCPNQHADSEWFTADELVGRYFDVRSTYVDHDDEGCLMLLLEQDPGREWCSGTFRKIERSTQTIAEMIRTPVIA